MNRHLALMASLPKQADPRNPKRPDGDAAGSIMRKVAAILAIFLATAAQAAPGDRFAVAGDDKTVSGLITRWVGQEPQLAGRSVKWEVGYDVPITNADAMNSMWRPRIVSSFANALHRLNQVLERDAENKGSPVPTPIFACIYSDTVVFRAVTEPCN